MLTFNTIQQVRQQVADWKQQGRRIAFVPTMGNLHAGHLSLMEQLKGDEVCLIVSIYVNPLQFGKNEDFGTYPRTLDEDSQKLEQLGVDLLYLPESTEIYPDGPEAATRVIVPGLADILEGESRPGFFTGVATVVNKLFNIVQPDVACFGAKDYQQLQIIRRMVADLAMPVEIVSAPTIREPDGLAMSSRNQYLTAEERIHAAKLNVCLQHLVKDASQGTDSNYAVIHATQELEANAFNVDYIVVRRQQDLGVPEPGDTQLVALAAVKLGKTRLIDNICFEINNT